MGHLPTPVRIGTDFLVRNSQENIPSKLNLISSYDCFSSDPLSNTLICKPGQNFCSGYSLQTNILMSCAAVDVLKVYSCDVQ